MAGSRNLKPIIEAPQSRRSPDIPERLIIDSRAPSPYHDLWKLEPEEDLIQLDSSDQFRSQNLTSSGTKPHKYSPKEDGDTSDECRREFPESHQPHSLLDLDDHPSDRVEEESDEQLARRLHAEWNGGSFEYPPDIEFSLPPEAASGHNLCEHCNLYGPDRYYCNVCDDLFCNKCWDIQTPHRKNRLAPGGLPHEITDQNIATKIRRILEPKRTEAEEEELHQNDEATTWFGVIREDGEPPLFQDYGRCANLMTNTSSRSRWMTVERDTRIPSLVSFVGQTGAGKSTIIKLVIDLSTRGEKEYTSPVVGSAGRDLPTSGDVHLYSDPQTVDSDTPILYADCEGLDGGEREPLGARQKATARNSTCDRNGSSERNLRRVRPNSERAITWADTNTKRSREFAVKILYPRLLYSFSDVVVFVLKNPRVIESVFEKLVDWAAAALEKSSNQPVLPHAIIILNASENDIDPRLWDVASATTVLFESLSETVFRNATFKKYANFWRERNCHIETVEQLLLLYYSSIKVVRVPTNGRPNLINDQIRELYTNIQLSCASARRRKGALRMILDAEDWQPYLRFAFDHFACNLDTPFDFVQASFTNSPIPLNFGGNILKLAINLMEIWENEADIRVLFTELSYMVASCIMLDSARRKIRGTAKQIFPEYLEHIDAALSEFCDRHWPCEYIKPGGGARCVNVRSGHSSKGHQLKNGKILAVGAYVSQFSFENYHEEFRVEIYSRLDELLKILRWRTQDDDEPEAQAAAEIHKENVMVHFFDHSARGTANKFISHSTCFSCLIEPPEHALPCGHVLCTPCIKAYGESRGKLVIEMHGCPMETLIRGRNPVWKILLKPAAAGMRILTLDGGGARGIAELEILKLIERALGGKMAIQLFFDLVVGTSTGGIIALGLAAKNWSVERSRRQFEDLCHKAFTRRRGCSIPGVRWIIDNYNHSMYETQPLQEALIGAFSEDGYLFGGLRPHTSYGPDVKVAVTTSAAGKPVVLANYNRLCFEKLPYHFQRPERLESEIKVWEAARATSAAPRIFKPFYHSPSKQTYVDGAIYHNNPIQIADKERKLIWPNMEDEYPDIVVSIGTTYNSNSSATPEISPTSRRGVISHGKSLYKITIEHIASSLDSEKIWRDYSSVLQQASKHRQRYVRLNPVLHKDPPRFDDIRSMRYIQEMTKEQMSDNQDIRKVALRLVASTFYFEKCTPVELASDEIYQCKGFFRCILCRLLPDSSEISELEKFLKRAVHGKHELCFVIQDEHPGQYAEKVVIYSQVIEGMIRQRQFEMDEITVRLSYKNAITEISLCISEEETYTISRFPRSLQQDERYHRRSRQNLKDSSGRWAGQRRSQKLRQKEWLAPNLTRRPLQVNRISRYSTQNHVFGDSSADELRRIARQFQFGTDSTRSLPDPGLPPELSATPSTAFHTGTTPTYAHFLLPVCHSPTPELPNNEIFEMEGSSVGNPNQTGQPPVSLPGRAGGVEEHINRWSLHETRPNTELEWNFF